MARSTPRVEGGTLLGLEGQASAITVGTPAWYTWLEEATTFAFSAEQGRFTARKERSGRSGWYWKAYRKREGTLHRAYLGKSTDLTLERLTAIATELARRVDERLVIESTTALGTARPAPDAEAPAMPIASLPTGTLTFLFTDIEGSTQLWERHPQAMPTALARHDTILREVVAAHGGSVFKMVGDSIHAVFARAADAIGAALAAQRALVGEAWGSTGPLRVRMALHTGVAELRDGDYFGGPLNRVARILALGHGGQILLSRATHDLVADDLPSQTTLRALGEHALKDLSRPEQIFQVDSPGLPREFPSLRVVDTLSATASEQAFPLLITKMYVPPPRSQLVPRARLALRVQAGLKGKLTLITAPAGFGKTTLLSEWRATPAGSATPIAWVSLDANDNDPIRFWSYVVVALNKLAPDMGGPALALLQSPQSPPVEVILTQLLNALTSLPTDVALVLEDYHVIDTLAIHQSLAFLIDHLPPRIHLVITSRVDPPLPLTRLRARGELTDVRATDLRFTPDETATFLTTVMGLPLSVTEVAALDARTEGWIASLQFAALAMRDRTDYAGFIAAFAGSNRFVVDYLAEEVIDRLPGHLQTFVLETSILDRMCGPLCDAVVLGDAHLIASAHTSQHAYSQMILAELDRLNLFLVSLDDTRQWYRFHHLFAAVLRERLTIGATAEFVATLHRRASAWFEHEGLLDEALRHALATLDVERPAALIERYVWELLHRGEVLRLRTWLEQMPKAVVLARPRLALASGWAQVLVGHLDAVEVLLRQAMVLHTADLPDDIAGELAMLQSWIARYRNDAASMLELAERALELLPTAHQGLRAWAIFNVGRAFLWRGNPGAARQAWIEAGSLAEAAGTQWIALAVLCELGALQARQGQLSQAVQTFRRAMQMAGQWDGQPLPVAGLAYVFDGWILYERNELERAVHELTYGIELLGGSVEEGVLALGYAALAHIKQANGDRNGALAIIRQGEEWLEQMQFHSPVAMALLAAHRACMWIQQGDLGAAAEWAESCGFTGENEIADLQDLTLVRLRLAQYRHEPDSRYIDHASEMLARRFAAATADGSIGQVIEILVLQALAGQAQADTSGLFTSLERALILAEPEGYVRVFVDEGMLMAELLRAAHARGILPDYVAKLLAAFPRAEYPGLGTEVAQATHSVLDTQSSALVEPLTDRELEVLRRIAAGQSNGEIAQALVVAVSTVKTHVNRIFGKLGATSRTQAVARARDLHIL